MVIEIYFEPQQKKYANYVSKVLNALPENTQDKICNECVVFIIGWIHGEHYWFFEHKAPIIINAWCMEFEGISRKQKLHVIAHEFAHHVLEHIPQKLAYQIRKNEMEADNLAIEWGFPPDEKKKD